MLLRSSVGGFQCTFVSMMFHGKLMVAVVGNGTALWWREMKENGKISVVVSDS